MLPFFVHSRKQEEEQLLRESGVQHAAIDAVAFPRRISVALPLVLWSLLRACMQSMMIIHRTRPSIVMSMGGYVSVPVCFAAWMSGIPIVMHIADSVPSVSDRLIGRMAKAITAAFPIEELPSFLQRKAQQVGHPIRPMISSGTKPGGMRITGFSGKRPVLLVMGGSQGATSINAEIDRHFDDLVALADIIHLTGRGKELRRTHARYVARPLVNDELPHFYALADLVVTRAGAGSLAELSALGKPSIVIPLEGVAHDHQLRNAEFFSRRSAVRLIRATDLSSVLLPAIRTLIASAEERMALSKNISITLPQGAATTIRSVLSSCLGVG